MRNRAQIAGNISVQFQTFTRIQSFVKKPILTSLLVRDVMHAKFPIEAINQSINRSFDSFTSAFIAAKKIHVAFPYSVLFYSVLSNSNLNALRHQLILGALLFLHLLVFVSPGDHHGCHQDQSGTIRGLYQ